MSEQVDWVANWEAELEGYCQEGRDDYVIGSGRSDKYENDPRACQAYTEGYDEAQAEDEI